MGRGGGEGKGKEKALLGMGRAFSSQPLIKSINSTCRYPRNHKHQSCNRNHLPDWNIPNQKFHQLLIFPCVLIPQLFSFLFHFF